MSINFEDFLKDIMNSNDEKSFWGLDFGSYRSMFSYKMKDMDPEIVRYKETCLGGVPSEYWLTKDGKEYVGDAVLDEDGWIKDPEGQCASIKMKLKNKTVSLHGKTVETGEILLKLALRIIEITKKALYEDGIVEFDPPRVIMGIPARFEAALRGTLGMAWSKALGISFDKIKIVIEPILAAMAYDYYEQKTSKTANKPRRPKSVFDMGHGTFDTVVLKPNLSPNAFHPEPYISGTPDGNNIAGEFFDKLMEELIIEKLRKNPGMIKLSVLENKAHADRRRLLITAREVKEKLSKTESTTVIVAGAECGFQTVEIKRSEFEDKIRPYVKQNIDLAYKVLMESGLGEKPDIDVLLIGGSTNIPLIEKMLKEKFNWLKDENFSSKLRERAVALGAAVYAESLATNPIVEPKIAYGYAVETHSNELNKDVLRVQIESGADLPQTISGMFYTRFEGQDNVCFRVYEVESGKAGERLSMNKGNPTRYSITHHFGKKVPIGTKVELTTTLSKDGILSMKVDDFENEPKEVIFTLANVIGES